MDPSATPVEEEEEEEEWMVRKSALPPPPPFLVKTYAVVEDPATEEVISWNDDGTAFVVWQPAEFARDLLPKLFKHCNFSSFVRQLNTYGFRKVATGRWEFCNKMFRKGERELLCKIRRKKAWSQSKPQASDREDQRSSLTSSFSGYSSLLDQNKRLKKENGLLSSELAKTKTKCKELLELVESYKTTSGDDDEDGLKLFGVKLE